jgi:hypothetical protein
MKFGTVNPLMSRNPARAVTWIQASHIVPCIASWEVEVRHGIGYGALLIGGSAVLLIMGMTHPSSIPFDDSAALGRMALVDALAHSLAILGTWLLLVGLVGLSRMLGLKRVTVVAALAAFALATFAVMIAAAFDGLVLPKLAQQWMGSDTIGRGELKQLIRFCVLIASSLTRIYLLLGAIAIALWSWVIHRDRLSRGMPWVGAVVAAAGIAALFGGPAYVSTHEVLALMVGQSVWMVLAGLLTIRWGAADGAKVN